MQREIHHREVKATKPYRQRPHETVMQCNQNTLSLSQLKKISHTSTFNCSLCLLYSCEPQLNTTSSHLVTGDSERCSGKCRETINEDELDKVENKRVHQYQLQDKDHKNEPGFFLYKYVRRGKYHND